MGTAASAMHLAPTYKHLQLKKTKLLYILPVLVAFVEILNIGGHNLGVAS